MIKESGYRYVRSDGGRSILASREAAVSYLSVFVFVFVFRNWARTRVHMHSSYVQGTISMCSAREKLIGSKPATTQLIAERV